MVEQEEIVENMDQIDSMESSLFALKEILATGLP